MQQTQTMNGIDVEKLTSTIERMKANPEAAKFTFRTTNVWKEGTHNRATVQGFYGALQEHTPEKPVVMDIDEPPVLFGKNLGANPVEDLLAALSGCMTTTLIAQATAQGIKLDKVESRYEGDLDLQGLFGLSEQVPVGFKAVRVFFKLAGGIPEEKKNELIGLAQKYSPVYNSMAKSVPISVQLDRA